MAPYQYPTRRSILAIDPAWTTTEPSGVTLLQEHNGRWRCLSVAPSYAQFIATASGTPVNWTSTPSAGLPDAAALVDAAHRLAGEALGLVTVDMPISTVAIRGRRSADDLVSKKYGGQGCGTHSPSAVRPGPVSARLSAEFASLGFPLATTNARDGTSALVEVFPHPALLVLMTASYRVPYKISRAARYWKSLPPSDRRRKVLASWHDIYAVLAREIDDIDLPLPAGDEVDRFDPTALKRYEDAIDALVCGWVGIRYLAGSCVAYGDSTAAIWVPSDLVGAAVNTAQ